MPNALDLRAGHGPLFVLDLCSGGGGLSLSLKLLFGERLRTVAYVERESRAAATLVARMGEEALDLAPVWDDVRTFQGRSLRGSVHLVVAGYPCQPFSRAGKRGGHSDPRHLWPHVRRLVVQVRPRVVFLENVGGHLSLGFREVRAQLRRLGYRVEAGLFSTEEVGGSHLRERLFILAVADSDDHRWLRCTEMQTNRNGEPIWWTEQSRAGLADTGGAGRAEGRTGTEARDGRPTPTLLRRNLAHAEGDGRQGSGPGEGGKPLRPAPHGGLPSYEGREELAHAIRQGLERVYTGSKERWRGDLFAEVGPAGQGGGALPLFPPRPGDLESWAHVLAARPDLAPALPVAPARLPKRLSASVVKAQSRLFGVAAGMAGRMDRLQIVGNGVDPMVACTAFASLWHRLRFE